MAEVLRSTGKRLEVQVEEQTGEAETGATVTAKKRQNAATPVWYMEEFTNLPEEKQIAQLPFCVGENLTLKQFHAKCDKHESGGCFRWEFKDGKAWIYELPHVAHEETTGLLVSEITAGLGAHHRDVRFSASPRCDDSTAHLSMEPDGAIKVRGHRPGPTHPDRADSDGNRWPNIIFEVAFRESESHVRSKADKWLNTTASAAFGVQQVIVVKIGASIRTDGHRTMKAWRYERGAANNPVQTIEFGYHGQNHGATMANLPGMQLQIPVVSIYHPAAVPAGLGPNISIDLFYVRQTIEEAF